MNVIGLDIGGAHLKHSDGWQAGSRPFALWRHPEQLAQTLAEILQTAPREALIAATMTGELADCFPTRRAGVQHILDALAAAAGPRKVFLWQTGGEFVSLADARELVPLVAAANWHALATWAGRSQPRGNALLIDMGSTTTDIIPIEQGLPAPQGRTDLERLASGELLYLGARRTPLCAVLDAVELRGRSMGLARELFATTLDVGLQRGSVPEDPEFRETANGGPATRAAAADRLARMVCSDCEELTAAEIDALAEAFERKMLQTLSASIQRVASRWTAPPDQLLFSGEGSGWPQRAVASWEPFRGVPRLDLSSLLGSAISGAACAFALVQLARERLPRAGSFPA